MTEPVSPEPRYRVLLFALLLMVLLYPHAEQLFPELRLNLLIRLAVLTGAIRAISQRRSVRWAIAALAVTPLPAAA